MTTATATRPAPQTTRDLLTADDLLRLSADGVRSELIRGVLSETMPTGIRHGQIVVNLSAELRNFVKPRQLGVLVASDSGVWLERDPDTVREPDVAFFPSEKMPPDKSVPGYAEIAPDLVVEIVSPNDRLTEVNDKALMWLRYGVRLVWVVRPEERLIDVHRDGHPVATLGESESLDGLDVLPGFSCAVREVFGA